MSRTPDAQVDFDDYASHYVEALNAGLRISGEDPEYFARGRLRWLANCLSSRACSVTAALDYGCGVGDTAPLLQEYLGGCHVIGVDLSQRALELAGQKHGSSSVRFLHPTALDGAVDADLAYCNGVFHHIVPADRAATLQAIHRALKPGGLFAFWENNPWNPGTRYIMSRVPFDRDAITISVVGARRMLRENGFTPLRTDFLFLFPRQLRWLRSIEPWCTRLPLGAQYQVLCQKT